MDSDAASTPAPGSCAASAEEGAGIPGARRAMTAVTAAGRNVDLLAEATHGGKGLNRRETSHRREGVPEPGSAWVPVLVVIVSIVRRLLVIRIVVVPWGRAGPGLHVRVDFPYGGHRAIVSSILRAFPSFPALHGCPPMTRLSRRFYRAHGLGNDYLVCEAVGSAGRAADGWPLTTEAVVTLCRRGWGEGSDGLVVLLEREPGEGEPFPLRMFNPDGSEFERSGNGLRILASWLHREGLVGSAPFQVRCGGIDIPMQVHGVDPAGRYDVSVDMGAARVGADAVDAVGWEGGALEVDHADLGLLAFVPVWVGNPHAVVFVGADADLDGPLLQAVGLVLATHPGFRRGTNVQLARVTPEGEVHIGIWERGVGRTSASGTSSCAAAVAAVATGRRPAGEVRVRMPGGELRVAVSPGFGVTLRGPVQEVAVGELTRGFLARIG